MNDVDTSVIGEISLFFQLEMAMNEDKACEHSQHNDDPFKFHSGDAEYYLHAGCPHCGDQFVQAVCVGWINALKSNYFRTFTYCGECRAKLTPQEFIRSIERI